MANQVPPRAGGNAYEDDGVLRALTHDLPAESLAGMRKHGTWLASADAAELARLANVNPPILHTHDARGERVDRVEFHPAYHALMRRGIDLGLAGSIWEKTPSEAGMRHRARAARFHLHGQLEQGHQCPLTMTNASLATIARSPELAAHWAPRILSRIYDSAERPAAQKNGATVGMGMTERQGGSDIRSNTTAATPRKDGLWEIDGAKWFFSAPMCDAFLVLAQTSAGLGCFLLPRHLPDGAVNGIRLDRLKPKLGNRSNASSEVRFEKALASPVGDPGQGIAAILDMVTLTRLDCSVQAASILRTALAEAVHHARHRQAFGSSLIDKPLMARVLADLTLDLSAAQALTMRLAGAYDGAAGDADEATFARVMTPAVKYWTCKIVPGFVAECLESLGGNGYVEDSVLPRLYREAPLNAVWEGSGNIMCLDVLRVARKDTAAVGRVVDNIAGDLGPFGDRTANVLRAALQLALEDEGSARFLTEQLAVAAAGAAMRRQLPHELADAFCDTRMGRPWRHTWGMLDARYDARGMVDFAFA